MALLSIACPECGARVKSSKGFKRGQAVSCPKCETDFTVGETASADESLDKEWSYKNSWMRFAVLGVLLVVLGVLGYMLYDKKRNEGKDTAGGGDDDEDTARLVEPRIAGPAPKTKLVPVIPSGGPGPRKANGEPQPQTQADEMKKALVGTWEAKREDETHTVEYTADGSFTYNVDGKAKKSIEGRWKVAGIEPVKTATGTRNLIAWLRMEWVPEGQEAMTGRALYNELGPLTHPLLDRGAGQKGPTAIFNKKN